MSGLPTDDEIESAELQVQDGPLADEHEEAMAQAIRYWTQDDISDARAAIVMLRSFRRK